MGTVDPSIELPMTLPLPLAEDEALLSSCDCAPESSPSDIAASDESMSSSLTGGPSALEALSACELGDIAVFAARERPLGPVERLPI
jgi:hypothetical protein